MGGAGGHAYGNAPGNKSSKKQNWRGRGDGYGYGGSKSWTRKHPSGAVALHYPRIGLKLPFGRPLAAISLRAWGVSGP